MKKIAIAAMIIALAGCVTQNKYQNERVGDLAFIYDQYNSELAKKEADVICGGKSYYIGVVGHGYSGRPGSMRIPFACTQKAALENDSFKAKEEVRKSQVKKDMQLLANIPWDGEEARRFFLKETHYFMLLDCGWAGDVGFVTGVAPTVLIGKSYYPGDKATFSEGRYRMIFNGSSMFVSYNPQKVSGNISDSRSMTPCSAVRLVEDD